jgi:hypothetical protein
MISSPPSGHLNCHFHCKYTTAKLPGSLTHQCHSYIYHTGRLYNLVELSKVEFILWPTVCRPVGLGIGLPYSNLVVEVTLRPTISPPVCLGVRHPKSKSYYDRQLVGQSVLVSGAHLGPTTNFSISLRFSFRQLLFVMFVAHSLMRGRVCNLL